MILDYSTYFERQGHRGIVNYKQADSNIDLFAYESHCPFCKEVQLETVYRKSKCDYPEWLFGSFNEFETVLQCPQCGWWEYKYHNQSDAIIDGIAASDIKIITAELRKYDETRDDIPIGILRQYIDENPDRIYSIHDKGMERLVQSVFSDFYNCDVELVGKSHDGGKDLIMLDNGSETFIQVKRRMSSKKVESVIAIRELIGAAVLGGVNSCIFVSTADHFSTEAKKAAKCATTKCNFDKFELIDGNRFLNMLHLVRKECPELWRTLLTLDRE